MKHIRFLSRLLNRPQMIAPAAGAAVLAALMPGAELRGWDGEADRSEREARAYGVVNGIAIIPIVGELVHRGAGMDAMSGLTSYQALADMVSDALSDRKVSALLLEVDSPGGEAPGCLDFAEWVAEQRGVKPIWASVNQQACSAAYAIACGADRILIGESATAGSIGVAWYHTDISEALRKGGVNVTFLSRGARKLAGRPELPLSDEDAAMVDRLIGHDYDRFCALVARNRGLPVEAVQATEAAVLMGRDAIAAGLADDIATLEEALMNLSTQTAPTGARLQAAGRAALLTSTAMAGPSKPKEPTTAPAPDTPPAAPPAPPAPEPTPAAPAAPAPAPEPAPVVAPADVPPNPPRHDPPATNPFQPAEVAEACTAAGFPQLAGPLLRQGATMAQVKERLAVAGEIRQAATLAGKAGMAASLVEAGMSLEAARTVIFAAAASNDAAIQTDPTHSGGPAKAAAAIDPGAIYGRLNTFPHQRKGI